MKLQKNALTEAVNAMMKEEKAYNPQIAFEWDLAFRVNRGAISGAKIRERFGREWRREAGASKVCHTSYRDESGAKVEFKYIVIKRYQHDGYIDEHQYDNTKYTGNQIVDEFLVWDEYKNTKYADYFCPIFRAGMLQGDHADHTSESGMDRCFLVSMKATNISDAYRACMSAEMLNREHGYSGASADDRYEEMAKVSRHFKWRDAMHNQGNSGVIYDPLKGCFKAVFIDYGL